MLLMLSDRAVHIGVFTDDLGGRCYGAPLEAVVLGTKPALEGKKVQVVVDRLLMGLCPELHVDLMDRLLGVLEGVLGELIEHAVLRVKYLVSAGVGQHFGSHKETLPAHDELIGIAVIFQIDLLQSVDAVGEQSHAHGVGAVIVC